MAATPTPGLSERAAGAAAPPGPRASQGRVTYARARRAKRRGAAASWTEERGTSDEGRRRVESAMALSGKHCERRGKAPRKERPGGERETERSGLKIRRK